MAREAKVLITSSNNIGAGIKSAVKDLTGLESNAVRIGKSIQNAFSAAAVGLAVKQVIDFGVESVKAFGEVERKMTVLKVALGGNESSFARMNTLIQSLSRVSLSSKGDIQSLVGELAALGKSDADIERISTAAIRLSNVTGQGLNEAMKQVNNTFSGSFEELAKLVPEIKGLTKEQLAAGGAVDLLNKKFSDISDSMANGVSQRIKNLSDDFGDLRENIGEKMKVAFDPMLTFIDSIVAKWNEAYDAQKKYQKALEDGDPVLAAAIKRVNDLEKQIKQQEQAIANAKNDATGILSAGVDYTALARLQQQISQAKIALAALQSARTPAVSSPSSAPVSSGSAPIAAIGDSAVLGLETAFQGWNFEGTIAPIIDDISQEFYDAATKSEPMTEAADTFKFSWEVALDSIKSKFQEWGSFAQNLVGILASSVVGSLDSIGAALYDGTLGWDDFGSAGLRALAEVLKALGAQLAAMAVLLVIQMRWVAAAAAVAGSVAAYIAAGYVGAAANDMSGSSSSTSSYTGSGSTSSSGSGASYAGAQSVTFNFYNQGNVVGSGGLEELATLINNLITRQARYA